MCPGHKYAQAYLQLFLSLRFYYRQGEKANCLTFNDISKAEATEILNLYLQDYLSSQTELKWAITKDIREYFKSLKDPKKSETTPADRCRNIVELSEDPYLVRVITQTETIDFQDIAQRT